MWVGSETESYNALTDNHFTRFLVSPWLENMDVRWYLGHNKLSDHQKLQIVRLQGLKSSVLTLT